VRRIYGEEGEYPELGTAALLATFVAAVAGAAVFVRQRYQHMVVTK
jgi:hypothetical protein